MRVVVVTGRRMEPLPPSRAPLLFGVGFGLLLVGAALRAVAGAASLGVTGVGLAVFVAGAFAAWLRLTDGGRVIVGLPPVAWGLAFVVVAVGTTIFVAQLLAVIAVALTLFAFVVVIRPMGGVYGVGMQRGAIETSFVRSLSDEGLAECRLDEQRLTVHPASGKTASHALEELAPPKVEEGRARSDLVIVDAYGDQVVRLRASSAEERKRMQAFADELERRRARVARRTA